MLLDKIDELASPGCYRNRMTLLDLFTCNIHRYMDNAASCAREVVQNMENPHI
jgi:hypothetical protein